MKIGLFSDPHYCKVRSLGSDRRPYLSLDKIKEAMDVFKKQGVDVCFCMGDIIDHAEGDTKKEARENLEEVLALVRSYNIPFYLIPGNHDYLDLDENDLRSAKINTPPYIIETREYDFIALDANYRSCMERFDKAGVVWDDSNLPPFQMEFLKDALENSSKKCVVLLHENLDPTVQAQHIVKNHQLVRQILSESGKVKLVLQGHFHEGSEWFDNGIIYHTVAGMCQGESNPYEIIII